MDYLLYNIIVIVTSGTLTPDGTISLDCGSQETFTCSVTGAAAWTISRLSGISVTDNTGLSAANNNARITTTDTSGGTQSSTITITGFTTADNGGTIQCIDLADGRLQGMASISIGDNLAHREVVTIELVYKYWVRRDMLEFITPTVGI